MLNALHSIHGGAIDEAATPSNATAVPTTANQAMHNLTVLAFNNPSRAFQVRDALFNLQGESLFELAELAVVIRDDFATVAIHQANESVAGCASAGSVVGLILGAIFAIPWAGSAVEAGIGAVVGALSRFGIDGGFIKELGSTITPGTSALAILGSKAKFAELGGGLGSLLRNSTILRTNVDTDREKEIRISWRRATP